MNTRYFTEQLPFKLLPGVISGVGDGLDILVLRIGLDPPVHGQDLRLLLWLHPPDVHGGDDKLRSNERIKEENLFPAEKEKKE